MLYTINKENIIIKKLNNEDILSIYTTHSVRHFPDNERKPVSSVKRMTEEGIYTGYGLYEKKETEELLCYAFFAILPDRRNILLDYFAVMEEYRSHGIGSLFLQHMKDSVIDYDGILIEVEDPAYAADNRELMMRDKRIAFYTQNGTIFTGILAEVFGVHYRLLFFPILSVPSVETLFTDFDAIYQHMVSKKHYDNYINITLPEN